MTSFDTELATLVSDIAIFVLKGKLNSLTNVRTYEHHTAFNI